MTTATQPPATPGAPASPPARTVRDGITKDTVLCMSLSGRPSNTGTRFHNHLYDELGLDYVYKAFTTTDPAAVVAGVRALGVRGCAISMPFKEAVIPHVDVMDPSAAAIGSVNTLVNDLDVPGGHLTAYNTDYLALAQLLREHEVPAGLTVAVRGSGGMAKAAVAALRDGGWTDGVVVARNEDAGRALADAYGFAWCAEPVWSVAPGLVLNATPIGMAGGPESEDLSFPQAAVDAAEVVFDVVAVPSETPLVRAGRAAGKTVITGGEVVTLQALEQFVLYTGIRPEPEQVARAAAFSRP